jgi:hypothetical protein
LRNIAEVAKAVAGKLSPSSVARKLFSVWEASEESELAAKLSFIEQSRKGRERGLVQFRTSFLQMWN